MINTIKTYDLPSNLDDEINDLNEAVQRFKSGEMSEMEFKIIRVPFGVYEQRKKDTYMVRIRCAGSIVTPEQLKKIAEISNEHAGGYIHLTTRQEIQLHYVLVDSIVPVVKALKTVGLSSRGGGGNTVRNIMAQEDAGIAKDDVFDVSPYAIALTGRMISEPDSWNLPRKFKFAFSGSSDDRGYATLHDVGFIAKMKDGKKGFKVYFAGGLGAKTQLGLLLYDWIEEDEVYNVGKAVKNLFYKNGNRKNKHAARLRFLVKTLGEEELKKKYFEEYELVKKENHKPLEVQTIENVGLDPDIEVQPVDDEKDFALWKERFVQDQQQEGLKCIIVPAHLGHVDNGKAVAFAEFMLPFGENTIRIRKDQNFLIRNIKETYLPNVYNFLRATFENFNRPFIIDKVIACAGASTCQLGICLSPGAATATKRHLEKSGVDLDKAKDARINISGCPNSCGQHHVGHLGFFGKVARQGDKVFPAYNVISGAKVKDGETEFAEKVGEVASKNMPYVVHDVLESYSSQGNGASFEDYMRSDEGKSVLKEICTKYKTVPDIAEDQNYYFDWGTDRLFSVAERGKGECSAGIFDLIENDLGNIQQARKLIEDINENGGDNDQKGQILKDLVFYCSRVLLVAKALQPSTEAESYNFFREYFINGGLVAASFNELITAAEKNDRAELLKQEDNVFALADRMKFLYDVMNPAFQFELPEGDVLHTDKVEFEEQVAQKSESESPKEESEETSQIKPDVVADFRGVGCPMNFVKTKMELSKMDTKQILEVWLDDGEPIDNVPGSVRSEGHKVLDQNQINGYWKVLIEKS